MERILFATANAHKVAEVQQLLGVALTVITPARLGYLDDIPETGDTLEENAVQKARFIYEKFRLPCFADDTGLEIDALHGAPGVYSARYAGESKDAAANMQRVLHDMKGITRRSACFRTVVAFVDDGRECLFEGKVAGTVLTEPRGDKGFGYDPVFCPQGYACSYAEMEVDEKNRLSHRAQAIRQFVAFLKASHTGA